MASKKKSIVDVWTWFTNVLDTNNLSASEQLVMLHLIKHINRNFWEPINITTNALARSVNKDARTVKTALSSLLKKSLIHQDGDNLQLGLFPNKSLLKTDTKKTPSDGATNNRSVEAFLEMNDDQKKAYLKYAPEDVKQMIKTALKGDNLFKSF